MSSGDRRRRAGALALVLVVGGLGSAAAGPFVNFETVAVRPVALALDESLLLAVNTPDGRVSVMNADGLDVVAEIPVGLEPVSVAARPGTDEAWVANNLSGTVSIVSLAAQRLIATVPVGVRPADIVFTPDGARAFVSLEGEHRVAAIDAASREVLDRIELPFRAPRSLAMHPDGKFLYAASFLSGNRTRGEHVRGAPSTVVFDPDLPDRDVVMIDTDDGTIAAFADHVGTLITAIAVDPDGRRLYVTHMDARNLTPGEEALRGVAIDNRLTILDVDNLSLLRRVELDGDPPSRDNANAEPAGIGFRADGRRVYIASAGSGVIQVLDETGRPRDRLPVGVGIRGLATATSRARVYGLGAIRREVVAVDTDRDELANAATVGFDPTPPRIRSARRILYDANLSGTGKFACAGCHAGGHLDDLAWNLGTEEDPKGAMTTQSLRGLREMSPYHWRGERPDLESFNPAFDSLMGGEPLPPARMRRFAGFLESIVYPPNPGQRADRILSPEAVRGREVYEQPGTTGTASCISCHALRRDDGGPAFGTDRRVFSAIGPRMGMKTPQLRGLESKTRYRHDGTADSLETLFSEPPFTMNDEERGAVIAFLAEFETETMSTAGLQRTLDASTCNDPETLATIELLMDRASRDIRPGAGSPEVELQAQGVMPHPSSEGARAAGLLFLPSPPSFRPDNALEGDYTFETLREMACAGEAVLTFTGVPAGTGERAVDRDRDGLGDGDEEMVHRTSPSSVDSDRDGLDDRREVVDLATDPLATDTDDDGVEDGREIEDGTDPLDPSSGIVLEATIQPDGATTHLTWTTRNGRSYRVLKADLGVGDRVRGGLPWQTLHESGPEDESPTGTETHDDAFAPAPDTVRMYITRIAP